jgi:hypothetical protein
MRPRLFAFLGLAGLVAAATPAFSQPAYNDNPPSFYYQAPDGSYDSISDLSRAIWGVPLRDRMHAAGGNPVGPRAAPLTPL